MTGDFWSVTVILRQNSHITYFDNSISIFQNLTEIEIDEENETSQLNNYY